MTNDGPEYLTDISVSTFRLPISLGMEGRGH